MGTALRDGFLYTTRKYFGSVMLDTYWMSLDDYEGFGETGCYRIYKKGAFVWWKGARVYRVRENGSIDRNFTIIASVNKQGLTKETREVLKKRDIVVEKLIKNYPDLITDKIIKRFDMRKDWMALYA